MPHPGDQNDAAPRGASRFFNPILAGATLRDRLLGCAGALVAIALTGLISNALLGQGAHLPLLVAPMGASAVLLFAVPASPLAQPWSIIGGNIISAMMGVIAAMLISNPVIATGVGVALAIAAMSVTRSLHPPGGAAALTAVLGGPAVASWGLLFPFVPVGLNSCILVGIGLLFHRMSRHNYPHRPAPAANPHKTNDPLPNRRIGFTETDIDAALARFNEAFDIDRDDLGRLLRQVELEAVARAKGDISCRDIMSRDVVAVHLGQTADEAKALLLRHNLRTLPVEDAEGRLLGLVGLREIASRQGSLASIASPAVTARADEPALSLLPALTDGVHHAAVILDEEKRVIGLVSQTDLLSAVARSLAQQ